MIMRSTYSTRPRQRAGHARFSSLLGLCLALCGIMLLPPSPPTALADGGAPNLAYIAGGGQGLSVVDIGQQTGTRNLALGGDPASVYLTQDGRYVYVAQPGLNKITMLAALADKPRSEERRGG